jgi:hypothetical protein
MTSKKLLLTAMATVMALLVVGCGGGSDTTSSMTRAEFIKQAEAVCVKTDKIQEQALKAFLSDHKEMPKSKKGREALIEGLGIPSVQVETEELAALTSATKGAREIDAFVTAMEEAVEKTKEEPLSMTKSSVNPFDKAERLATKYGFKECAEPL